MTNDTSWRLTASDIVRAAMQELALIAPGETPEASELNDAILRLNGLLKSWAAKGGNLFRETTVEVVIPADAASILLDTNIRSVSSARVIVSPTYERLMQPFNRSQYLTLPNKISKGQPSIFYAADSGNELRLYVWPVPMTATTLSLDHARVVETVTGATETVDIPEDWQEAVYTNLAVRIAPMFQASVSPELMQRAQALEAQLLDSDRPDSYFFEAAYN